MGNNFQFFFKLSAKKKVQLIEFLNNLLKIKVGCLELNYEKIF
jgi:hypothetical protein